MHSNAILTIFLKQNYEKSILLSNIIKQRISMNENYIIAIHRNTIISVGLTPGMARTHHFRQGQELSLLDSLGQLNILI